MNALFDFKLWLDVLIIVIPILIAIILVYKFVFPKKPALGVGLMVGAGLLGSWLVGRRLKNAFDVEKKLAEFSKNMEQFKNVQKRRQESVMANKQVIDVLQEKRKLLEKDAARYETEIRLIDAELKERLQLNEKLIINAEEFLIDADKRSAERQELLELFRKQSGTTPFESAKEPTNKGTTENPDIELDGYRLLPG